MDHLPVELLQDLIRYLREAREPRLSVQGVLKIENVVQTTGPSKTFRTSMMMFEGALLRALAVTQTFVGGPRCNIFGLFMGSSKGTATSDDGIREPVPDLLGEASDFCDDRHMKFTPADTDPVP